MKVFYRFLLTVVVIMATFPLIAARSLQPADPTDLLQVLEWLALGPGALIAAGAALAFVLEIVPGWGSKMPAALRPWIVLGLTIAMAFGARALLAYPDVIQKIAPIYTTLFLIVSAWLGTQLGYARAKVAGTKTYGKGSVNILRQLDDGSGLYITNARWLTPNGRLIEGEGIEPDIELELTGEEATSWAVDYLASKE